MSTPFIEENDQTRARREHLEAIRALVGNAYPNKFRRTNVTGDPAGEDTVTALTNHETLASVVNDEAFSAAFTLLASKVKAGERPAPEDLEPVNAKLNAVTVRVSGRIATPPRVMGKAAFVHLSDGQGRLQIYVRKQDARAVSHDTGQPVEEFESGWKLFQLLDHGDFVGVEGELFVTKTGELSVHVRSMEFLSKALVPMPDKLHGIADPEIRQRQRYADLIASSLKVEREDGELTTREVFERRSRIIREMRRHLDSHGYIEVETPMLTPIASGAAARPFVTHHNALDIDLYARIAPELYLKRLLVGGFERVYELNRNFRNEGIDRTHNPEFTMLEFYCAYMDVNGMMDFCEEMLRTTIEKATGGTTIQFEGHEIDFGRKFERLTMKEAISKYWPNHWRELDGEDFRDDWLDSPQQVERLAKFIVQMDGALGIALPEALRLFKPEDEVVKETAEAVGWAWAEAKRSVEESVEHLGPAVEVQIGRDIAWIFEMVAEYQLIQPAFIKDFPKPISPLSKASPDNSAVAERFELYIMGMECANGFSELNDPVEQYQRFEEQMMQRERGDDEAMQMDVDYVRALSYGMPPAAGIGIGIDRLVMLLTNRQSIRDVILFPHMRPQRPAADADPEAADSE